ncbi:hypothetical protein V6Z05_02565 [Leptospira venezuelensis]|uniref:hypothetical protein n=1 Tax=Leptospira venezuelensis TaxID=1958811 RepID=UPI000A393F82|nr:hypothetical protein [Leptospira venezuelensis]
MKNFRLFLILLFLYSTEHFSQPIGQVCTIPYKGICIEPKNTNGINFVKNICETGGFVLSNGNCISQTPLSSCYIAKNDISYTVYYLPFIWDNIGAKANCLSVLGSYSN